MIGIGLTFFSAGSWTVSASLLSALRICEAATFVDVFSNACSRIISNLGLSYGKYKLPQCMLASEGGVLELQIAKVGRAQLTTWDCVLPW